MRGFIEEVHSQRSSFYLPTCQKYTPVGICVDHPVCGFQGPLTISPGLLGKRGRSLARFVPTWEPFRAKCWDSHVRARLCAQPRGSYLGTKTFCAGGVMWSIVRLVTSWLAAKVGPLTPHAWVFMV